MKSSHEGSPDRAGRDGVASDTLVADELIAQCTHERNHGTLGRSVVDEFWMADGHVYRGVESDG